MPADTKGKTTPPDDGVGLMTTVTIVVLAGGLVIPILGGTVGRTCGARVSTRLEQARRQAEIQRITAEDPVERAANKPEEPR